MYDASSALHYKLTDHFVSFSLTDLPEFTLLPRVSMLVHAERDNVMAYLQRWAVVNYFVVNCVVKLL